METATQTYIPEDPHIPTSGGPGAWRFANGEICRGSKEKGNYVTAPNNTFTGLVKRFSEEEGEYQNKDGEKVRYHQLEFEMETRNGTERFRVDLIGDDGNFKASGVAVAVAWGLKHSKENVAMSVRTTLGRDPVKLPNGKLGAKPTFVNWYTYAPGSSEGIEIPRRQKSEASANDVFLALLTELQAHPLYKQRPFRPKSGTALAQLVEHCDATGWYSPVDAPTEWLAACAKQLGKSVVPTSLPGFGDDEWEAIRQSLTPKFQANQQPKFVADIVAARGPKAASVAASGVEEEDPFA